MLRNPHVSGAIFLVVFAVSLLINSAHANLFDDFARPDGSAIGNGWIEKNAAAFTLESGSALKGAVPTSYRNNIVYRPSSEDVLDVEASAELTFSGSPGYPQVGVRLQSATVQIPDILDGYVLYVDNSASRAILGRQTSGSFVTTLATINITPALNTSDSFRLRLSAQGTNPVILAAYVERLEDTGWQTIGQAMVSDSAAERIDQAGSVGFGGYIESTYRYNSFSRVNLGGGGQNPAPVTTGITPAQLDAGSPATSVSVFGTGFTTSSVVRINGEDRPTNFVAAGELSVELNSVDLATPGTQSLTVFNPTPGGGVSNAQSLQITPEQTINPMPQTTGIAPASAPEGGSSFTLTVNGSGFVTSSVVRLNGEDRTTTYVSASQLTSIIPASDLATVGTADITVFSPTPGGGISNGQVFVVTAGPNPLPAIGSLSPDSVLAGSGSMVLTVTGTNFVPGSVVRFNGTDRETSYVSSNQLTAAIPAEAVMTSGSFPVEVFNSAPGGGLSNTATLTVTLGGSGGNSLTVTGLDPQSVVAASGSLTLTVFGSNFAADAVVRFNGLDLPTTQVSSTELQASVSADQVAAARVVAITVSNPGGPSSGPTNFFVLESSGRLFADGFQRPSDSNIGNGWTEKTPSAFSMVDGQVSAGTTTETYHDTLVYRPFNEDELDVEVGMEFTRLSGESGFAQLHARAQRDTIQNYYELNSYIFYVDDFLQQPGAAIAIQPPGYRNYECVIAVVPFPQPLVDGDRYRLRFQVRGSYPVNLTGIVEQWNGNSWQSFAEGSVVHDANTPRNADPFCPFTTVPVPITTGGAVGFAKWVSPSEVYDNFYWMSLGGDAPAIPAPVISQLSPTSATAGSPGTTLTVTGNNFTPDSVVRWGAEDRPTTYVSQTSLTATLFATDFASAGTVDVTVADPVGGVSAAAAFSVLPETGSATDFVDDFSRPSGPAIGNGWIEKAAGAFSIVNGQAAKQAVSSGYLDNIVYRPSEEDLLDVEASVEFTILSGSPGYPQVLTRAQSNTVGLGNWLDAYMLYIDDSANRAILGRQRGSQFVTALSTMTLTQPIQNGAIHRLRLRSAGADTVQLAAYVERFNGSGWDIIGQATYSDTSAARINTPGSVGFGGYVENNYVFDNFARASLAP